MSTMRYALAGGDLDTCKAELADVRGRLDGRHLIFVAVVLALGATILAGLVVRCVVDQHGMFTGEWSFRNFGLKAHARCTT